MKYNTKIGQGLVFCCGFLLMLCAGLVFSWSVFAGPIEAELGFTRQQTSLVFPFSLSVSILGQMIAGVIQKKGDPRYCFLLSAALFLSGFWLAARSMSIGQLLMGYGILAGLAIGIIFNTVLSNATSCFPNNENLATGLLLGGFGLGSMVLGSMAAGVIQTAGWRAVFAAFAAGYTVLSLLGAVAIRPAARGAGESATAAQQDASPTQLLRLASYRAFFLWSVTLVGGALVVSGHAALCVAELNADPMLAALAVTANSLPNVLARMVFGYSYQRLGERWCKWLLTLLALSGGLLCLLAYAAGSLAGLLVAFALLGAVNGGNSVVGTAYIRESFGRSHFSGNIALTNLHLAIASFMGPAVAGAIRTRAGSYTPVFAAMVLIAVAAAALLALSLRYAGKEKAAAHARANNPA